jgi:tetratricopeptide (TPR) repeat protein
VLASTLNLGIAYSALGRSHDAIGCLEEALASARQQKDKCNEASALISLAVSSLYVGAIARARDLFAQARSLGDELADKRLIRSALGGLGNTCLRLVM